MEPKADDITEEAVTEVMNTAAGRPEVRVSQQDLPPSPPLTRSNSETSRASHAASARLPTEEKDIADPEWDPLQYDENAKEVKEDQVEVSGDNAALYEGDSVVDINGRVLYPQGQQGQQGSSSQLQIKPPAVPQPWDLIDPPYATVASQKYSVLQNSARDRSLIPKSSYYFGAPPPGSAYGTPPIGQIGVHHPREIIRVERDYSGGELVQFAPIYPLELEGRITPTQFLESINCINELLISAHSVRHSMLDNLLAIFTLHLSTLLWSSHYEREMELLQHLFNELNLEIYNPAGLNLLWPRRVAFLFLEIEYY